MHTTIVKLYSLANAIGAAAENNNFSLIGNLAFIFMAFFESRIEIRCLCLKLSAAGIHHFINPCDACGFSFFINFLLASILNNTRNLLITKSMYLGPL